MQHTDKATAAFEAWYRDKYPMAERMIQVGSGVWMTHRDEMKECWLASRAELVIELPPQVTADDAREAIPFDADGDYAQDAANMVNGAIFACGAFAKAAGVTVRG